MLGFFFWVYIFLMELCNGICLSKILFGSLGFFGLLMESGSGLS